MNAGIVRTCLVFLLAGMATDIIPAWAGGPLYVTGPAATEPGQPYRWILNPIPYKTDRGGLGNQTNAEANSLVLAAFQVWQNVGTANVSIQNSGQLGYDVTKNNIMTFQNNIGNCSDPSQPANAIIYDVDGSIMTALGMDNNSVLGFAGNVCSNDETGVFTRGWSVLNGRFIDGNPETPSHQTVTLDDFKTIFIHEFGHLLGLDHSQINLNCLTDDSCSAEEMDGVPMMFPILLDGAQSTLNIDDKAALSMLYPAPNFDSTTGRIQGRVLFSDGQSPAQGYNVIARSVADPSRTAVSCVSGFLFTAGAGNPFLPEGEDTELFYGSHDQLLIGYYDIPGLPPGDYRIEVEAIYNSGTMAFTGDSGVGPIGSYLDFQYKMPGKCDLQYLNYPSSPNDDCSAKSTVTVVAGVTVNTHTDVILLGTPPRYDPWEDGP